MEKILEAVVLTVREVEYVTETPFTTTVNEAELVPAMNPLVMHLMAVPDKATISHLEPSEKVTSQALPSVRLCGRAVPEIVRNVPPYGFRSILGETLVTVRGT
jgi:hypothetical protein